MLKLVKRLNYDCQYAYAPPQEDAVINLDRIVSVVSTDARGIGPFVAIRFVDGTSMTCVGEPRDFIPEYLKDPL
jgi:hypothetical protein